MTTGKQGQNADGLTRSKIQIMEFRLYREIGMTDVIGNPPTITPLEYYLTCAMISYDAQGKIIHCSRDDFIFECASAGIDIPSDAEDRAFREKVLNRSTKGNRLASVKVYIDGLNAADAVYFEQHGKHVPGSVPSDEPTKGSRK